MKIAIIIFLYSLNVFAEGWRPKIWIKQACNVNGKTYNMSMRECFFVKQCESVELNNKKQVKKAKNCQCGYSGEIIQIETKKDKEKLEVEHIIPFSVIRDKLNINNIQKDKDNFSQCEELIHYVKKYSYCFTNKEYNKKCTILDEYFANKEYCLTLYKLYYDSDNLLLIKKQINRDKKNYINLDNIKGINNKTKYLIYKKQCSLCKEWGSKECKNIFINCN